MPTYEYECRSCQHVFERFQAMSEAPVRECPECGKEVRRIINGGTGIIFKGSGFYVNDTNGAKKSAAKTGGDACASCAKSDAAACPAGSTAN
jgi:putative FmdB family regulatory protein